jgi:hypothetical protein
MNGSAGFRIFTPLTNMTRATTSGLFVLSNEIEKCQGCTGGGGSGGSGPQGPQGSIGLQGPAGSGGGGGSGTQGFQGRQGSVGTQGPQGNFSGVMSSNITMGSPNLSFGTPQTALGSMYVNNVTGTAVSPDGNPNPSVYVGSNIMPTETNKYDLGSPSLIWRRAYFGPNTVFIGDVSLSQSGNTASTSLLNLSTPSQSVELVNTSPSNNKIPQSLLPFSSFVYGFAITYLNNESPSQRTNWSNQIYSIINELNPNYNGLDNTPSLPTGSTALNFSLYSGALSGVYYIIQFPGSTATNPSVTLNIPTLTFPTTDNGVTFTFSNIGPGTPNNQTFKLGDIVLFGMAVNSDSTAITCSLSKILFEVPVGSIGSDKIADLAVTHTKLGYGSVWTDNILDSNVTFDKLNDDVITYIGSQSGSSVNKNIDPIAIGVGAGETGQSPRSVAIGYQAGNYNQGPYAIAIGYQAGATAQVANSIVINASGNILNGETAGFFVSPIRYEEGNGLFTLGVQGFQGIAGPPGETGSGPSNFQIDPISIGIQAGQSGQGNQGIAIGNQAGNFQQGSFAIAIGYQAGLTGQSRNSIIMNASGQQLNAGNTGLFIKPLRFFSGQPVQLGVQGLQGVHGFQGIQGFQGYQGFQGTQGYLGPQGGVAGLTTQLQYNLGGNFAGSSNMVYDNTTNIFAFGAGQTGGEFKIVGNLVQGVTGGSGTSGNALLAYRSLGRYIELGADNSNSSYLDFHSNDTGNVDFDTRIISSGGNGSGSGLGNLTLYAQDYTFVTSSNNSNPYITFSPNFIFQSGNILPSAYPTRTRSIFEYNMSGEVNPSSTTPVYFIPTSPLNSRNIWKIEVSITNGAGNWNYYNGYCFQNNTGNTVIYAPASTVGTSPVILFGNTGVSPTISFNNNTGSTANYMIFISTI